MLSDEITVQTENKLLDETKPKGVDPNVIKTEPKSDKKQILSSKEELERLGLRENPSDPCLCLCCIFCMEVCFTATGGAPPIPVEVRYGRKLNGMHNWDNDSTDGNHDDNDDANHNDNGMDWAIAFANNITGNNSSSSDRYHDNRDHDGDDGGDGDGGDGGGGGGDSGGGGE